MTSGSNETIKRIIVVISIVLGLFHLYTAFFGVLTAYWQRSLHLGLGMLIAYLLAYNESKSLLARVISFLGCLGTILAVFYVFYDFDGLVERYSQPNTLDLIVGAIFMILVLDFTRRIVGKVLPIIAGVFLIYALAGPYLPGILWHRGYDIPRLISQISLSTEGIFGTPLGVSANYIFLFVLFGALLQATKIGQFYIDIAVKSVGRSPGGPAKAAVVASSLFGSVSGSAVANVAGTGSITIPLMRSIGYRPQFAGAVESVASTGGQFMPPIMGAAAFIMAEIIGIPYYQVALGALIPALIYYGAVFAIVHFRAKTDGLSGTDTSELPSLGHMMLKKGIMFAPLIILIFFLVIVRISVMKAAVYSVIAAILIGIIVSRTTLKGFIDAFVDAARTALVVITSTATAGIVVAIINLTGLGMKFSNLMINAAGDYLILVLFLMMVGSLILGMGLPTTPAYLILAVLGAPTLIGLGVEPLAAHMFVFYFGCISMITPPVALAVYAATTIAKSNFWKTAYESVLLGLCAFIVPYMFVYSPELLGKGEWHEVVMAGATGILGAVSLGAGIAGWLLVRAKWYERMILVIAGLLLIVPEGMTNIVGILGIITVILMQRSRKNIKTDLSHNQGQTI